MGSADLILRGRLKVGDNNPAIGAPMIGGAAGTAVSDEILLPRRTRITLTDAVLTIDGTDDYGSLELCKWSKPTGILGIIGSDANLTITRDGTNIPAAQNLSVGIGSQAASATTLSAEMVNVRSAVSLIADQLTDTITGGDMLVVKDEIDIAVLGEEFYLNASAAGISATGTLTLNGWIDIMYFNIGDLE